MVVTIESKVTINIKFCATGPRYQSNFYAHMIGSYIVLRATLTEWAFTWRCNCGMIFFFFAFGTAWDRTALYNFHNCALKSCQITWTLAKSTLLRSLSIWLIWEVFCRTALAAWAKWLREVYRRRVCAKAVTAPVYQKTTKNKMVKVCNILKYPTRVLHKFLSPLAHSGK